MTFTLPDYWLTRPHLPLTKERLADFAAVIDEAVNEQPGAEINYQLAAPKWHFLCYLCEQRGFALHGSASADITIFEPRQSSDINAFGAQKAVYAASDGIWPMFFAILDRKRVQTSIINACICVKGPHGQDSGPRYFFSVEDQVLPSFPWTPGWVYVLPRGSFSAQPPIDAGDGVQAYTTQLASTIAVEPVARLRVEPADFPFLGQVRTHDGTRLEEYARALNEGLPWPGETDTA